VRTRLCTEVEKASEDGKGAVDIGTSSERASMEVLDEGFSIEYDGHIKEGVSSDVAFAICWCDGTLKSRY